MSSSIDFDQSNEWKRDPHARTPSYYALNQAPVISDSVIQSLVEYGCSIRQNVRLCLHATPESTLHEMVIFQLAENYFAPKCHPKKEKSFHVRVGALGLFLFDDQGGLRRGERLCAAKAPLMRVGCGFFHADIPITPFTVHIETTLGPFLGPEDRVLAPWGPTEEERSSFRAALLEGLPSVT